MPVYPDASIFNTYKTSAFEQEDGCEVYTPTMGSLLLNMTGEVGWPCRAGHIMRVALSHCHYMNKVL